MEKKGPARGHGDSAADAASEYRDRARFYAIRQADGERAYDWYKRVQAAAVRCGFGAHRRTAAIADKFVTGLRPGPVADRLLGHRADGPLHELLAAAAETETGLLDEQPRRPGRPPPDDRDVLAEIRDALKLYRYSDGDGSSPVRRR
ncbi:Hypothetical protein CINCED_3A013223 [Cinara cedri]|uniref:Uncharacterized protein n=1 Tax=Cinara cedri TaxID=506608 RepID=A0A5E4MW82_9HEMI|nr:Hypothetical protein CINCED_3A013223 [Cinara cedri]